MRLDYWKSAKNIALENLVFLDETGILLGLTRTHARSQQGTRAYALTPFYRGAKVTARLSRLNSVKCSCRYILHSS